MKYTTQILEPTCRYLITKFLTLRKDEEHLGGCTSRKTPHLHNCPLLKLQNLRSPYLLFCNTARQLSHMALLKLLGLTDTFQPGQTTEIREEYYTKDNKHSHATACVVPGPYDPSGHGKCLKTLEGRVGNLI